VRRLRFLQGCHKKCIKAVERLQPAQQNRHISRWEGHVLGCRSIIRRNQSNLRLEQESRSARAMKILEAQSAQLTNYEVYTHLTDLKRKSNERKGNRALGRPPGNLETIVKEVCILRLPVSSELLTMDPADPRLLRPGAVASGLQTVPVQ
jgi:hypothetical protein